MSGQELLEWLRDRGVVVRAIDGQIGCRVAQGKVSDEVLERVRAQKEELLALLGDDVETVAGRVVAGDCRLRSEHLKAGDGPRVDVELWSRRGLENLLAVARRGGFDVAGIGDGLIVHGPESASCMWRLLGEQSSELSRLLRDGC